MQSKGGELLLTITGKGYLNSVTSLLWFKDGMHIYLLAFLRKEILVLLGHMNPV